MKHHLNKQWTNKQLITKNYSEGFPQHPETSFLVQPQRVEGDHQACLKFHFFSDTQRKTQSKV